MAIVSRQEELEADFAVLHAKLESVEGLLFPSEGYALMLLAANGGGKGEIVEIGSFMGRSTCWLATGSKRVGREKVHAIDHFIGSPEHQPGGSAACEVLAEEGTTYGRFRENIRRAGVEDYVEVIASTSEEVAENWNKPIRLLFIDGDHSYESVRLDFGLWSPFVIEGGFIAFHDVGTFEGVTKFYTGLLKVSKAYREIFRTGSLAVVHKVPVESHS